MGIPRSIYYYKSRVDQAKHKEDMDIKDRLEELALRFPRYGYRRMSAQLNKEGFSVNHKRVLRPMHDSDLLCRTKCRLAPGSNSPLNLALGCCSILGMVISYSS